MKKESLYSRMFRFTVFVSFLLLFSTCLTAGIMDTFKTAKGDIKIYPINHATFVLQAGSKTTIFDPVGSKDLYSDFLKPDYIIITHSHPDHYNAGIINSIKGKNTVVIGPEVIGKMLPGTVIMKNGDTKKYPGIRLEAVPMYNTTKARLIFHQKGFGNGYILTVNKKRIYISGDTEDIPEMRKLKDIDIAFICMNLPYTMDVKQASSAVLEFKPKIVYPYHYRGAGNKFSDLKLFKKIVSKNRRIEVRLRDWYKK